MKQMYKSADITSTAIQFELLLYHYAVCVSSADPRLAPSQRASAQSLVQLPEVNLVATGYAGPPFTAAATNLMITIPPKRSRLTNLISKSWYR